ncbi:MAG TPA: pantetheine-phosphate adenylyltransferase, partial [Dehalococcoidia bacterium]|nr:pantetheine-phosphate adenylyltransferase [Dehalococcoidia bacterium]
MTALYPGSFDPVTLGHVDIANRASALFDKVIIGVYATPSKSLLFDAEERISLFARSLEGLPNVEVRGFEGLV